MAQRPAVLCGERSRWLQGKLRDPNRQVGSWERTHTRTHPGYRETSSRVSEIPSLDPPALFLASQLRQLYSQAADREGLLVPRADLDA